MAFPSEQLPLSRAILRKELPPSNTPRPGGMTWGWTTAPTTDYHGDVNCKLCQALYFTTVQCPSAEWNLWMPKPLNPLVVAQGMDLLSSNPSGDSPLFPDPGVVLLYANTHKMCLWRVGNNSLSGWSVNSEGMCVSCQLSVSWFPYFKAKPVHITRWFGYNSNSFGSSFSIAPLKPGPPKW